MPRDLESERDTLNGMPPLSSAPRRRSEPFSGESPTAPVDIPNGVNANHTPPSIYSNPDYNYDKDREISDSPEDFLLRNCRRDFARDQMHPFSSTLTIDDIEDCIALENAAFPEDLRASRAKVSLATNFPLLLSFPFPFWTSQTDCAMSWSRRLCHNNFV